ADDSNDLDDMHIFGELTTAIRTTPVLKSAFALFMEIRDRDLIAKVIKDDESDLKPLIISDDNDDERDATLIERSHVHSNSQTQQYPSYFSNLDLE
ncbi:hypothetical protein S245_010231, partial [Arachis hypogaea]